MFLSLCSVDDLVRAGEQPRRYGYSKRRVPAERYKTSLRVRWQLLPRLKKNAAAKMTAFDAGACNGHNPDPVGLGAAISLLKMIQTGIARAFGPQLRRMLGCALGNRFKAFFAGVGVTSIIPSGTA